MLLCPSMELTVSMEHRWRGISSWLPCGALMPRDMLGDAATLGDGTDTGKARVIMRNGKYPCRPAQSPVFADYAVWRCRAGGCWTPRPFSGG